MQNNSIGKTFTKEKIQYVCLAVLCCFNILPPAFQTITIISLVVSSVFFYGKTLNTEIKSKGISLLIISTLWLLLLYITTFYSIESKAGVIFIRKTATIIAIVFVVYYLCPKLSKQQILTLLKIAAIANVFYAFYIGITLVENLTKTYLPELKKQFFINKLITIVKHPHAEIMWYGIKEAGKNTLFIHKTYLSLNLVFSIFCVSNFFIHKENKIRNNVLWLFVTIILATPVFFFVSMVNIPILILGVTVIISSKIKSNRKLTAIVGALVVFSLFFAVLMYTSFMKSDANVLDKSVYKKVNYIASFFNITEANNTKELTDIRSVINSCSRKLIKQSPIYGYGIGEQHIHLTGCYAEKKEFVMVEQNFNSHNFYYFILLSGGVLAFIPFIYMLYFYLKNAIFNKSLIFILFLILVIMNLLIENILVRVNGILFFSVFLSLLYRYTNFYAKEQ